MRNSRDTTCGPVSFIGSLPRATGAVVLALLATLHGMAQPALTTSDIAPDTNPNSDPDELVPAGDFVYFVANDGIHGRELWRTDGTPDGTILASDIWEGPESSNPADLCAVGDAVFFLADSPGPSKLAALWVSHGTPDTTVPVESDDSAVSIDRYFSHHGTLGPNARFYFAGPAVTPHALWVWTCSAAGDNAYSFPLPPEPSGPIRLSDILQTEDRVFVWGCYYAWQENTFPREMFWVWRSENEPPRSIDLGHTIINTFLGSINGHALFRARDIKGAQGFELWISDGTEEGTHLLKDIFPGVEHGMPEPVEHAVFHDTLFFRGNDGQSGAELWISDGTETGTRLVKDINPGTESSEPGIFAATDSHVYFQASNGVTGEELWVSDGSNEGTQIVLDIEPGSGGSKPYAIQAAGDRVYFTAEDTQHGGELWVSDGTATGTKLVRDIVRGRDGSWPRHKAAIGGKLVFSANDGVHGTELWITDGTAEGTMLLKDIHPERGPNPSSDPQGLTAVGDLLFFVVNDAKHGAELWKSDGSSSGTALVKDIFPGPASSRPNGLTAFGNRLFFQAEDGTHGLELWVSDGTVDGTYLFADLNPGAASSSPHEFVSLNEDRLFFVATHPTFGKVLHSTRPADTTPQVYANVQGPSQLTRATIAEIGPCIYFVGDDGMRGRELWYVDAVRQPALVKDILSNHAAGSEPGDLTAVGDRLFFDADDGTHGRELFKTDGSSASTSLVQDLQVPANREKR